MTSPLPEPEWLPCGKQRHKTAAGAEAQRASLARADPRRSRGLVVFPCPVCHHYHVGHNRLKLRGQK